ncbi:MULTISPECIES: ABC transporter permease [Providencia]|uniref:ABC transporter permease n=2 Tax=Providencia TaxID=586 RepID=A0A345LY68_9GAMM|nr:MULTISPECIES: ABC transporter permease [Providencia]MBZ3683390.1 ABC transporter permease [Providencia rettgeri]AXH63058.1 ABC transporter permease [Providencia huaxiensis]MBQ0270599.1 ABC transporter permease [Providencia huaxiensis]MCG9536097.1 ABC transporter permease [Providencia huaxiensis]MDT0132143.1 ABC transporter permease [Providencia huaxiensis]
MQNNNAISPAITNGNKPSGLWLHKLVLISVASLLALPIIATFLYSIASSWGATVLPDALSIKWYLQLWQDPRFLMAFGRSLIICFGTLLVSTLIILPMTFAVFYRFPKLKGVMDLLIILPFAIPPVVSSVGLLQIFADEPFMLVGTPWILIGTYFTITLPFMYRALANSFQGINLHDLMDAAHLLGASTFQAFMMIVLPNIRKGMLVSLLISFSFLMGEFVFANILVGTRYETLQIYLFNMRQTSGHFTSALVMSYFLFTLLLTWLAMRLNRSGDE